MNNWNEIRTAYQVARLGTVTAAADALGLHRVTVIRHIDQLESALGEKLFVRHTKGYAPTPAGRELMAVAQATEDQFDRLALRIRAQAQIRAGEIVLTSLAAVAPLLMPALVAFRDRHPGVVVRHLASAQRLKLERGEAHVAIRAGADRHEPENVVRPLTTVALGLFASRAYEARKGLPTSLDGLKAHDFVALEAADAIVSAKLYAEWIDDLRVSDRVVFRSTSLSVVEEAIQAGVGLGFFPTFAGEGHDDLIQILPETIGRDVDLCVVTHVDFHRTPKIQSLLACLRDGVVAS